MDISDRQKVRDCKSLYSTRPDCKSARTGNKGLMKNKLILCLFMLLCLSCDVTRPMLINDNHSHSVQTSCGEIVFRAYSFGPWESNLLIHLNGEFIIIPQSLLYRFEPDAIEVKKILFWQNDEEIEIPDTIRVNKEEELRFEFRYQYKENVKLSHGYAEGLKMEILPSDFILCDDKAVINENMLFTLKKENLK